ncbi:MAG TPA: hypothetical protein VGX96_19815 [Candidatus Elarobacter sp.]|jgi:hypothetical protein|nr:hypothetical protein [Candidatus Elarobacter sp.]
MSFTLGGNIDNQSQYTLKYSGNAPSWGNCEIVTTTIPPGSNVEAFVGMSDGIFQGCEGSVTYTFTDQHGNEQSISMSYNDPFSGSNSASVNVPNGMTGQADVPSSGSNVTAQYTLSGEVR